MLRKLTFLIPILFMMAGAGLARPKIIHVFVALCDNESQGIVPVPEAIGDGENPEQNLYWGAGYGIRTFFANSADWELLHTIPGPEKFVLERCIFHHKEKDVYLIADAYRGSRIMECTTDFLFSSAGYFQEVITLEHQQIVAGGGADLVAYVGHNGLMDFVIHPFPENKTGSQRDVMILACDSKGYFHDAMEKADANPLLWTTGLMAPEAYTLKAAIDGWLKDEGGEAIRERAAKAYHEYQKCGINGAKNLFSTGL